MGKLLAICTSPQRGTVKTEVESARLTPEWGIETDAHGGNWHRQVSLLSAEKIENFRKKIWVDYGAFGENLVVEGYDFRNLPVTSRFAIGDVVLEMTQIGKECHNDCVIKQKTGECIMPREGVFARVLQGGEIHVGDEGTLLPPHRRRLCGGRDDAPARRGQGSESTAHPAGRWPSGQPDPDHRRHRLCPPGYHPGSHLCRSGPQRPRHC